MATINFRDPNTSKFVEIEVPTVKANPESEATEELTKIQIEDTVYSLPSKVEANPHSPQAQLVSLIPTGQTTNDNFIYSSIYSTFYAYNLVDNNLRTSFATNSPGSNTYVGYKFNTPTICTNYSLTTRSYDGNDVNQSPLNWIFQGSNDNSEWVDLKEENFSFTSSGQTEYFETNNETEYLYYRIYVKTVNGGNNFSLGEMQFYVSAVVYEDLETIKINDIYYKIPGSSAAEVSFDNTKSGLSATTVQEAFDELIVSQNEYYYFKTNSVNSSNASIDITHNNITTNYLYSDIKTNPLIIDELFKLEYGVSGYQWRLTALGNIYYEGALITANNVINEWNYTTYVDFSIYYKTKIDIGGSTVVANPTDAATEDLVKIQIDDNIYSIPENNGVDVEADGETLKFIGGSNTTQVKFATKGATSQAITFGIDEDGNYGYYKVGADTLTPFRTGENEGFPYRVTTYSFINQDFEVYKDNVLITTATFSSSGKAIIMLPEEGTYTLKCGEIVDTFVFEYNTSDFSGIPEWFFSVTKLNNQIRRLHPVAAKGYTTPVITESKAIITTSIDSYYFNKMNYIYFDKVAIDDMKTINIKVTRTNNNGRMYFGICNKDDIETFFSSNTNYIDPSMGRSYTYSWGIVYYPSDVSGSYKLDVSNITGEYHVFIGHCARSSETTINEWYWE